MDRSLTDWLPPAVPVEDVQRLAHLLRLDDDPVQIVDVGANPIGEDPPYQPMLDAGVAHITGFEPQPDALAQLVQNAGPHEHHLPHLIGDGGPHTLHLCASNGFTSLLAPDPDQLAMLTDFPALAEVTGTEPVQTSRLDEVGLDRVDLLKMDIQGGELAVVEGGDQVLADTVAVQTEVGFHRLYDGAPTFADVDLALRRRGFVPQSFVSTRTWPMAPVQWADPLQAAARQLVEADVLYVIDLARPDQVTTARLRRLALIAGAAYGAAGVTLRCLFDLERRGDVDPSAVDRYRTMATAHLDAHGASSTVEDPGTIRSRR